MPPLDKATSSVSSTRCGFVTGFGGENVVLRPPLGLFNFGSGVGETKSPENSFNVRYSYCGHIFSRFHMNHFLKSSKYMTAFLFIHLISIKRSYFGIIV